MLSTQVVPWAKSLVNTTSSGQLGAGDNGGSQVSEEASLAWCYSWVPCHDSERGKVFTHLGIAHINLKWVPVFQLQDGANSMVD